MQTSVFTLLAVNEYYYESVDVLKKHGIKQFSCQNDNEKKGKKLACQEMRASISLAFLKG